MNSKKLSLKERLSNVVGSIISQTEDYLGYVHKTPIGTPSSPAKSPVKSRPESKRLRATIARKPSQHISTSNSKSTLNETKKKKKVLFRRSNCPKDCEAEIDEDEQLEIGKRILT